MVRLGIGLVCVVAIGLVAAPFGANAQGLVSPYPTPAQIPYSVVSPASLFASNSASQPLGFSFGSRVKRMFNSFTSYQFGDPEPDQPDPLSRLEFPLDQWWGGLNAGYRASAWSLNMDVCTNLSGKGVPKFQDSDWLQNGDPLFIFFPFFWVEAWGSADQKNIFSQSECRLNRSYMADINLDVSLAALTGSPGTIDLRPVFGVRFQRFDFQAFDGLQAYFPTPQELIFLGLRTGILVSLPSLPLPGDSIRFTQAYRQYYVGGRGIVNLGSPGMNGGRRLQLVGQADYAYVIGDNMDLHLLRGDRWSAEKTDGSAWHAGASASLFAASRLKLTVEGDFTRISTTGKHTLFDSPAFPIMNWYRGVTVWSDQLTVGGSLELTL